METAIVCILGTTNKVDVMPIIAYSQGKHGIVCSQISSQMSKSFCQYVTCKCFFLILFMFWAQHCIKQKTGQQVTLCSYILHVKSTLFYYLNYSLPSFLVDNQDMNISQCHYSNEAQTCHDQGLLMVLLSRIHAISFFKFCKGIRNILLMKLPERFPAFLFSAGNFSLGLN